MHPAIVISRKREGHALSAGEITEFVEGFTAGTIPDYQMSALAMAICWQGMDAAEIEALTRAMLASGDTLERRGDQPPRVDKHSTGGVGDKVSLILAPALACCGVHVPMLSGRGLGATGGTLDKLESIPGFRTDLDEGEIADLTERVGCVITGTTPKLVPADRKLYALRDASGTVPSVALITASIMSKKLAENLSALVLDVKFGNGAFMTSFESARTLAESLVRVGERMQLPTRAILTDMNQPLGRMCGNAVEVQETLDALDGNGPDDLMEVTFALGAASLAAVGSAEDVSDGRAKLEATITSGAAMEKFREMVAAQGGDLDAARPIAEEHVFEAESDGYVAAIDTLGLGEAIVELRGGRRVMTDAIDHSVGLEMLVRVGDRVERGQPWLRLFAAGDRAEAVRGKLRTCLTQSSDEVGPLPLIADTLESAGVTEAQSSA